MVWSEVKEYLRTEGSFEGYRSGEDNTHTVLVFRELHKITKEERYLELLKQDSENQQILLYLAKQTKEDHYTQQASRLWRQGFETISDYTHGDRNQLYQAIPFYMEAETLLGKKERYYELVCGIRTIRDRIDQNPERTEKDIYCFLMMLIHTIEVMSIEIFEHYKLLVTILKEQLKEQLDKEKGSGDLYHSLIMAYLILKSCRLGILLKEKYQSIGETLLEKADPYFTTWMEENKVEMLSMSFMAYTQLLQLKVEAGESITGFLE